MRFHRSPEGKPVYGLPVVEWIGIIACLSAIFLAMADMRLSTIPLTCFLIVCLAAPFLPEAGLFLPTISRGISGKQAVSITFDDGPNSITTPLLLNWLERHHIRATFFVTGRNVDAHPDLVAKILANGHSLGNHTYSHDNLLMLKDTRTVIKEIEDTQHAYKPFGVRPLTFRPPVGITSPRLGKVLRQLNLINLTFSCRAGDFGNRRIGNLSKRILKHVRPDDIILLHDVPPKNPAALDEWLAEMDQIMAGLRQKGLDVLPLSNLIGQPVMDMTVNNSV